jgi:hypothetical protein
MLWIIGTRHDGWQAKRSQRTEINQRLYRFTSAT